MKLTAIYEVKPATRAEIQRCLLLYEKDLVKCEADLKRKYKNGSADAVKINNDECKRRIAYYIPAIKELKWVLGEE